MKSFHFQSERGAQAVCLQKFFAHASYQKLFDTLLTATICYHIPMDQLNAFIVKLEDLILTPIVILLSLGATLLFVWGVVQFIMNSDNEEKRATGQQHMLYGIIGLAIIFGANAIISFMKHLVGAT